MSFFVGITLHTRVTLILAVHSNPYPASYRNILGSSTTTRCVVSTLVLCPALSRPSPPGLLADWLPCTATVVRPRQIAMYLSKALTLRSLPEIGRRFGGRDHTTVLHAVRKIENLCSTEATIAEEIELFKRLLQD